MLEVSKTFFEEGGDERDSDDHSMRLKYENTMRRAVVEMQTKRRKEKDPRIHHDTDTPVDDKPVVTSIPQQGYGGNEGFMEKQEKKRPSSSVARKGKQETTSSPTLPPIEDPMKCSEVNSAAAALRYIQERIAMESRNHLQDRLSPNDCKKHLDQINKKISSSKMEGDTSAEGFTKDDLIKSERYHCTATLRKYLKPASSKNCAPLTHDGVEVALTPGQNQPVLAPLNYFIDLGSRTIDQTTIFSMKYPHADRYIVHCFEANPAFNKLYPGFIEHNAANGRQAKRKFKLREMVYHNQAAGVMNATLFLSDKSVGSSIVAEGKKRGGGSSPKKVAPFKGGTVDGENNNNAQQDEGNLGGGGVNVPVISLAEFIGNEVGTKFEAALQSPSCSTGNDIPESHVVVKMDIEKMEFSVLNQMLRTGTLALVDDLLLECHYNTNKPKASRDLEVDIGKDDCWALVDHLNKYFSNHQDGNEGGGGGDGRSSSALLLLSEAKPFITVLWNDKKTAKSSGYMSSHGGFYPS